jgi:hypothetical protein
MSDPESADGFECRICHHDLFFALCSRIALISCLYIGLEELLDMRKLCEDLIDYGATLPFISQETQTLKEVCSDPILGLIEIMHSCVGIEYIRVKDASNIV